MSKTIQNTQHTRVMNMKYKNKYKDLKKQIKGLVFENAALCDEVSDIQAELITSREERRFLIKRLFYHEQEAKSKAPPEGQPNNQPKKRGPKKKAPIGVVAEKNEKGRLKARGSITMDINGKPRFPINLYNILIHSLGEIIPVNPNFHTANFIYPVGYVATRIYIHPRENRKCVYTCKILNNAGIPQFQIIPDNDLDSVFFGESANICHQHLLESLQRSMAGTVNIPMHIQGERFFGLSNTTVKSLLQMDPGFKQCANFRGFAIEVANTSEENDPTLNYDALQTLKKATQNFCHTKYAYKKEKELFNCRTMPAVKDEPPDELLEFNFK